MLEATTRREAFAMVLPFVALAAPAILVSGCSMEPLERDVVDDAFEESVAVMTAALGEHDHSVDDVCDWHKHVRARCGEHRYVRWELSSFDEDDAKVALDEFAATANAAGFSVGRFGDSPTPTSQGRCSGIRNQFLHTRASRDTKGPSPTPAIPESVVTGDHPNSDIASADQVKSKSDFVPLPRWYHRTLDVT